MQFHDGLRDIETKPQSRCLVNACGLLEAIPDRHQVLFSDAHPMIEYLYSRDLPHLGTVCLCVSSIERFLLSELQSHSYRLVFGGEALRIAQIVGHDLAQSIRIRVDDD